jgi:hypothetical protein
MTYNMKTTKHLISLTGRIIVKMSILPQTIYSFNGIPISIQWHLYKNRKNNTEIHM